MNKNIDTFKTLVLNTVKRLPFFDVLCNDCNLTIYGGLLRELFSYLLTRYDNDILNKTSYKTIENNTYLFMINYLTELNGDVDLFSRKKMQTKRFKRMMNLFIKNKCIVEYTKFNYDNKLQYLIWVPVSCVGIESTNYIRYELTVSNRLMADFTANNITLRCVRLGNGVLYRTININNDTIHDIKHKLINIIDIDRVPNFVKRFYRMKKLMNRGYKCCNVNIDKFKSIVEKYHPSGYYKRTISIIDFIDHARIHDVNLFDDDHELNIFYCDDDMTRPSRDDYDVTKIKHSIFTYKKLLLNTILTDECLKGILIK